MKRARALQNTWRGAILVLLTLPVAVVCWMGISWVIQVFNDGLMSRGYFFSDMTETALILFVITGFVWFPILGMLFVRDRWLQYCIRKQLSGIKCGACGYSLIGLSQIEDASEPTVMCPECGHCIVLREMGLAPADIDPALLTKS